MTRLVREFIRILQKKTHNRSWRFSKAFLIVETSLGFHGVLAVSSMSHPKLSNYQVVIFLII